MEEKEVTQVEGQGPQQKIIVNQVVKKSNGVGTAGFVFALLGVLFSWAPVAGWVIWSLGALLSFIGLFKSPRGLAITGMILSFLGLIILIVLATVLAGVIASL